MKLNSTMFFSFNRVFPKSTHTYIHLVFDKDQYIFLVKTQP